MPLRIETGELCAKHITARHDETCLCAPHPSLAGTSCAKLALRFGRCAYRSLDSNKYLPTKVLDVSTWRGDRRANHWNASRFRIWSSGT